MSGMSLFLVLLLVVQDSSKNPSNLQLFSLPLFMIERKTPSFLPLKKCFLGKPFIQLRLLQQLAKGEGLEFAAV